MELLYQAAPILRQNPYLLDDAYFTPNTFFSPGKKKGQHKLVPLPQAIYRATKSCLQWLNACFLDLDVYKGDYPLRPEQAEMELCTMAEAGLIPPPSIIAYSGRGLYVFWLLRNESVDEEEFFTPPLPEKATDRNIQAVEAINGELAKCCTRFSPDLSATNANRCLRLPGSLHTGVKRRVSYKLLFNERGMIYYTLSELAQELSFPLSSPPRVKTRTTKNRGKTPARRKGYEAQHQKRLHDLKQIEFARGGIKKRGLQYDDGTVSGGRRRFIEDLAINMRGSGVHRDEAITQALARAKRCDPPFPSDANDPSVESVVNRVYDSQGVVRHKRTDQELCQVYSISPRLSEQLKLLSIGRRTKQSTTAKPKTTPQQRRQLFILGQLDNFEQTPSQRAMAQLCTDHGFKASPPTIRDDYKALGLSAPESNTVAFIGMSKDEAKLVREAQAKLVQRRLQLSREQRRN
jgi:hypothetical protein